MGIRVLSVVSQVSFIPLLSCCAEKSTVSAPIICLSVTLAHPCAGLLIVICENEFEDIMKINKKIKLTRFNFMILLF